MNKLHPGARWLFRLRAFVYFCFLGIIVKVFLSFIITIILSPALVNFRWRWAILFLGNPLFYIFFVITATEIYARMSYNRWFYELTPDGIKIEKGIIWKRYVSIPYERIQNINIYRGIIARLCGFSTLIIQTAGLSGVPGAEGVIPAVDTVNAERIRDFIIKKINRVKGPAV